MKATMDALEEKVGAALRRSPTKDAVRGFHLEEDHDNDGGELLRVIFDIKPRAVVSDQDLLALMVSVEDTLARIDERQATVWFPNAA